MSDIDSEDGLDNIVLETLITTMKHIGRLKDIKGENKKKLVLSIIKEQLDLPEHLENFIMSLIDVLIQVEKGKLVFNEKIKSTLKSSLFKCCSR